MAAPTKLGASSLDAMLDQIRTTATHLRLVHSYTRADTWATINTNTCALYVISGGDIFNATYTNDTSGTGDGDAPNRRMEIYAQELAPAIKDNTSGVELCLLLDDGSEILAVTDETTNREVKINDVITTFVWFVQASQPTQVAGP